MNCQSCKKKVSTIDIYCLSCGVPTEGYKAHFKIKDVLQTAKHLSKSNVKSLLFSNIAFSLILFLALYFINNNFISDNVWIKYVLINVLVITVVPFLFLPFGQILPPDVRSKMSEWQCYTKFVQLSFCVALYFFILKVVCQGDPILNLVRLVMVCWGIAIVFPVPYIIFTRDEPLWSSIKRAYIAGKYLRWHQFLLSIIIAGLYLLSVCLLLIPMPTTMRYANHVMYVWYTKQEEFQLYEKHKDY
jgi:hypothetical protein